MDNEKINKLGAKVRKELLSERNFLTNIPLYEFDLSGIKVYFSQCDFYGSKDFDTNDNIRFYMIKGPMKATFVMSLSAFNSCDTVFIEHKIKECF